ncbi:MAG: outer membrane protein assembly factor BamE [Betaproteobacteria bacterium]|nr:outer membrane protein assembly factor BamE [Betaproteobacteria bacterium]
MQPLVRRAGLTLWIALTFAFPILHGCSLEPYRLDIQQGNVITQDMLDKLRPGMTRSQVKFVMGTPLVADAFHPERWDYFYEFDKSGNPTERRRLTLLFDDDRLARVVGDVKAAPELLQGSAADRAPAVAPEPSREEK